MAQIICEELQNTYSVAMITGVMTSKQRNTILHDFKAGVYQVLVATDALAYGVNLQFANSLINFDIPWNPAKRAQRIDRIHRIGITEPKFIYDLVSEGLETHAYRLITDKLEIFAQAVEGKDSIFDSSVLKQLSADYFDTFSD
jgi:SNF2 family DNA or RNA helicase